MRSTHADVVLSNEMISKTLAMVVERRELNTLLNELLTETGNEFHLRLPTALGALSEHDLDFWTLSARARLRGEVLLGYRFHGDTQPVLNPKEKEAPIPLHAVQYFVVLAETQ